MKWVAGVAAKVLFTESVHFYNLTWLFVQPSQVRREEKNKYTLDLFIRVNVLKRAIIFLLDPFHRRGRVLDRKFCLSVCLSVCPFVRNHFFLLQLLDNLMVYSM